MKDDALSSCVAPSGRMPLDEGASRIASAYAGKPIAVRRRLRKRILLDTNVWSYLVEAKSVPLFEVAARRARIDVLVAPGVVYEALEIGRADLQRELVAALTRKAWVRLMPEAYSECAELLGEMRRLRPQWLSESPDPRSFMTHRRDWEASKNGFWDRARSDPQGMADHARFPMLEEARALAKHRREIVFNSGVREPSLSNQVVDFHVRPNAPAVAVQPWRVAAMGASDLHLSLFDGPYLDWLRPFLRGDPWALNRDSWIQFWLFDVEASKMPRFWIRWAMEYLQAFRAVTNGTPGDSQISTYVLEADYVFTSDKNFGWMLDQAGRLSSATIAETITLPAGLGGVETLLNWARGRSDVTVRGDF